jgi:hypothetical protein
VRERERERERETAQHRELAALQRWPAAASCVVCTETPEARAHPELVQIELDEGHFAVLGRLAEAVDEFGDLCGCA